MMGNAARIPFRAWLRLCGEKVPAVWDAPSASYHVTNWTAEEWGRLDPARRPASAMEHDNGSWSLLEIHPPGS